MSRVLAAGPATATASLSGALSGKGSAGAGGSNQMHPPWNAAAASTPDALP
jgi:hypothetical protein